MPPSSHGPSTTLPADFISPANSDSTRIHQVNFAVSLLVTLIALIVIATGQKTYTVPPQVINYDKQTGPENRQNQDQSIENHNPVAQNDGVLSPREQERSFDASLDAYQEHANRAAFMPRYFVFLSSLKAADILGIEANRLAGAQVLLLLFLFSWATTSLATAISASKSPLGAATIAFSSLILFMCMNGRAAPAFLGYAILAWTLIAPPYSPNRLIWHALCTILGLMLCAMSTGTFLAAITLFFAGNFTRVGTYLRLRNREDVSRPIRFAKSVIDATLLFAALAFCIPLFYRLFCHFGFDLSAISAAFGHGAGSVIADNLGLSLVAALLLVSAIWFCLYSPSPMATAIKSWISDFRRPLILFCIPLYVGLFGYLGATLSLIGLVLIVAQIFDGQKPVRSV